MPYTNSATDRLTQQWVDWAFIKRVSHGDKLILLVLAMYADADGYASVGRIELMEQVSWGITTILKHLAEMENRGIVSGVATDSLHVTCRLVLQ